MTVAAQAGLFVARDAGGNGTTAKGARLALAGLLAKNSDGTVKVGVLADGQGPVVTGAAGMSYNVRKHVAVTKASEANGPVLVPNDGTVSVTTDPAPGSNSRIDVIYVLQPLVTGDGGSSSSVAPIIDVAKGAVAASPSVPAIPSGALELARVTVPSGTTATSGLTFTQGPFTYPGGVPSVRGSVGSAAPGINFTAPVTTNIVFPTGLFTAAPVPNVTASGARIALDVTTVTAAGMTIVAYNNTASATAPFQIYWSAAQS